MTSVPASSSSIKTASSPKRSKASSAAALSSSGVLDYIVQTSSSSAIDTLLPLYSHPLHGKYVVQAVLCHECSKLSQQVVLRLHCTGPQGSVEASVLQVWLKEQHQKTTTLPKHSRTSILLQELQKWAIVTVRVIGTEDTSSGTILVSLTPEFQKGLEQSLTQLDISPYGASLTASRLEQLVSQSGLETTKAQKLLHVLQNVTVDDLDTYTQQQWDAVLYYMAGTSHNSVDIADPPVQVISFLTQTGLMQTDPDNANDLVISPKGYDFMLQDPTTQVWQFVLQYLISIEQHSERGHELRQEALLLLICLSFCQVGKPYLASDLPNKDCRVMMKDLAHFGLLKTFKIGKNATVFYPTRIATQLVGNATGEDRDSKDDASTFTSSGNRFSLSSPALEAALADPSPQSSSHLAIIVQTNFQLCAYTTSELHVSMLALFCDVQTIRRLPNIVFMAITRDSVKAAFALGIQARQILHFLEKHAHPKLRNTNQNAAGSHAGGDSPIPGNVIDQIILWDREQTRVVFTKVYQHECLLGHEEYVAVKQYAHDKKALAWYNERRQLLFCDYAKVERIHQFARRWRAQQASRAEG